MPAIKLENKSARILLISLGGGGVVTVPPSDPTTGQGAVTLTMTDDEKVRFDTAVATPAVQEWIDAEELVISDAPDAPTPPSAARPVEPEAEDKPTSPSRAARPAEPERKHKHFFGGDKDKEP